MSIDRIVLATGSPCRSSSGILVSTVLTLIVIPVLYYAYLQRKTARRTSSSRPPIRGLRD